MDDLTDEALRPTRAETLAHELRTAIEAARDESAEDPFGNPILLVALSLTRRLDRGEIGEDDLAALVQHIGWEAVRDRAGRLRRYVGLDGAVPDSLMTLAERLAGNADAANFERFRDEIERPRFAAVFTAHPTFGMSRSVAGTVAQMASRGPQPDDARYASIPSFRPDARISLQDEFEQARFAVLHARDAIDALNGAFFAASRRLWRDRWTELAPRPVTLGSWVGCDTDGRTDIGWWDTLRYRLESKRGQFARILAKLPEHPATAEPRGIVHAARAAVERQLSKAPPLASNPSLEALRDFALVIVQERETALPDAAGLIAALDRALIQTGDDDLRVALCLTKAGCAAHGVSIAVPHFRLNASQLHNAMRRAIRVEGEPTEPARRRAFLAAVNGALDTVEAVSIDFGALAAERASATRMLMTIAQIIKHLDSSRPVRFLVAETETGYTLLSALWLARRLGVADRVEISPLFETEEGLEQGPRVIDEALRSPHWRNYLRRHGRFCIQFGYSDSGRYIGQIAASFWIERLRVRIAQLLVHYDLTDVELVIFDTHGESFGRGAHPASLTDRLAYLAPPWSQHVFARAGIGVVRESSFQGSDGYLLFGSASLAGATVSRIAESVFGQPEGDRADPIYEEPDFTTEFFGTVRQEMADLVDDPGYAALIGTFGPSLLDTTGSRPTARQIEGAAPARIRHPRELRAIPNNAILQQLGWLANSIHGLGHAASRAPDLFRDMRQRSGRFERAYRTRRTCHGNERSRRHPGLRRYARSRQLVRPRPPNEAGGPPR